MTNKLRWLGILVMVFALTIVIPGQALAAGNSGTDRAPGLQRVIVMFYDSVDPVSASSDLGRKHDLNVGHVYTHAIPGFSCFVPAARLAALQADPRVKLVEPDIQVHISEQLPTGVDRIEADLNSTANIDGVDDRVDVDIAIIDTGIDVDHPDLNVVGGRHFYSLLGILQYEDGNYDDDNGHGSHVAGIAAAKDNGVGVVGVAPGARLWAVKVLDTNGSGYLSDIAAGIDYVTEHADEIEVANMSLEWTGSNSVIVRSAISNSVMAGVVYFAAAGNDGRDIYGADHIPYTSDDVQPASFVEVATVSAMVDSDGTPGGYGSSTGYGADDSFASFSNFSGYDYVSNYVNSPGLGIDLIMPGVYITSTYMNGGYASMSGTSMASPHAAGLAALYIAENGRATSMLGTANIRQVLVDAGMSQSDTTNGLTVLNDPDGNTENIGWAGPSGSPVNNPPVADDQDITTSEDTPINITLTGSDADGDPLTFSIVDLPSHGTLSGTAPEVTYTPDQGFTGEDSFTFKVNDGTIDSTAATVYMTVTEINVAPVLNAIGDKNVDEGALLSFTATATDSNTPAQTLTFSLEDGISGSVPEGASITAGGDFTWTPTEAQGPGSYTFDIVVSDGALTDGETISVTVNEINVAPILDTIGDKTAEEGSLLSFTATANDSDIPSQTLIFSLEDGTNGSVPDGASITAGGDFTWTPTEAQGPGSYTFDVVVSDGTLTASETITVTVTEENVAPVLNPIDNKTVDEGSLLSFTATATDSNTPTQTLTFSLEDGTNGSVPEGASITADGYFTWTPTEAQGPGSYTFDIVVSDGALTDSETVTVTVTEVNVAPVLNPIGDQTVEESSLLSFTATANDSDIPSQTLSFSLEDGTTGSVPEGASITAGGDFTWTPTEAQGPDSYTFDIVVSDGALADSETITVTVTEPAAAPDISVTIDMSSGSRSAGKNTFVWAIATVSVEIDGIAAEGATVEGHWEAATSGTDIGTTDSNGEISLQSDAVKNPSGQITFTFVVDSVTISGNLYQNIGVSGSIDV